MAHIHKGAAEMAEMAKQAAKVFALLVGGEYRIELGGYITQN